MHLHLRVQHLVQLAHLLHVLAGGIGALQIGDVLLRAQGHQGGVVPGVLQQGAVGARDLGSVLSVSDFPTPLRREFEHRRLAAGRQGDDERVAAWRQVVRQGLEVARHGVGHQGDLTLDDAGRMGQHVAKAQRRVEVAEHDDALQPVVRRGQRQFDLQHEAVGAPHVVHQQRVRAAQFHELGFWLDGDGLEAEHVAARRQRPVVDGTHASKTSAIQAAQGGAAVGGRHAAQFHAAGRARFFLEVRQADAGLRPSCPLACPDKALVAAHVQHHPTVQRHGLAVVAGAGAPDGDGDAVPGAGGDDSHDLVLGARANRGLSRLTGELALEHRAEPGEVLRQTGDTRLFRHPIQVRQGVQQMFEGLGRGVHGDSWKVGGPSGRQG